MSTLNFSGAGELTHIEQRSTSELIADQIRQAILHGKMTGKEQLGEIDLASQFGVSRGPVREALQRLMEEGLVRRARNRGVFVVAFDQADVIDIYATREAIELAAARLILDGDVPIAMAALAECCDAMSAACDAGDAAGQTVADMEFHRRLIEASKSPRLKKIERTLLIESQICMTELDNRYADPAESVREHRAIVDALRTGDPRKVEVAISAHMSNAVRLLTTERESRSG